MKAEVIKGLIYDLECYEAHVKYDEDENVVRRESLLEHTERTVWYFEKIWKEKGLDEMLERFYLQMYGDLSEQAKNFWKEMISGIFVFHDLGKINPDFQRKKLGNKRVKEDNVFRFLAGRHSILSAVLYLDYFLAELQSTKIGKEEKKRLRKYLLYHAYIIERHHSDLDNFTRFIYVMEEEAGKDIIEMGKNGKCLAWKRDFFLNENRFKLLKQQFDQQESADKDGENGIRIYAYVKMLYSLLIASDYYATAEFMSEIKMHAFGNLDEIQGWFDVYEQTKRMQETRVYQSTEYPKTAEELHKASDINQLRREMFCDAEKVLKQHTHENLFYLEAPTGSGKSNTAFNLSFQLMRMDSRLKKIFYIYPFNTLVEQNLRSLEDIFGNCPDIFNQITVVNSLVPVKMTEIKKKKEAEQECTSYYQEALLDRQFLNYPMILSTHVSLFDTMFGDTKESAFAFHQLMNSVIVLDEIQSYKNTIWGEIICFLKVFSTLFNMKILIMSATLPDLDLLSEHMVKAVSLIQDKGKYYAHRFFKERVKLSYELLDDICRDGVLKPACKEDDILCDDDKKDYALKNICKADELLEHIRKQMSDGKKILVEFIKKDTAYSFYCRFAEDERFTGMVEYMSGDDSLMERSRILDKIKKGQGSMLLIATQVIEAGVDIDMDIGYKNISKLDSEEQFLGRINRSCMRTGKVYFFKLDEPKKIYREDVRVHKEFTLENENVRNYLEKKDFYGYYQQILQVIKKNYNEQAGEGGLQGFFLQKTGKLYWHDVKKRMQLIEEDRWSMSVYLARVLISSQEEVIDGKDLWIQYKALLQDFQMDYSEKRVKLSELTSKMNGFIYQIKKNYDLIYDDRIGEIFYIEDGEKYFEQGKLNRKKIQGEIGEFVDFI